MPDFNDLDEWLDPKKPPYPPADDSKEIIHMDLPEEVVERLNSDVGSLVQVLDNTTYPIWTIKDTSGFLVDKSEFEKIRNFLSNYSLTAYVRSHDRPNEGSGWGLVITPQVPPAVVKKLNNALKVVGQNNSSNHPSVTWRVGLISDDLNTLIRVQKWLQDEAVTPHLTVKWDPDKEPEYGFYNCIQVAPTSNKFDLLRFYDIYGGGYGTEEIIVELMTLDEKYGIDFIAPGDIQLKRLPQGEELHKLEDWYLDFCTGEAYEFVEDLARGRVGLVLD